MTSFKAGSRHRRPIFAAAMLTACTMAASASAGERDTITAQVTVADLNLAAPAGLATLHHRLVVATRQVCGGEDGKDLSEPSDDSGCRRRAMADAMLQVPPMIAAARKQPSTALASGQRF